MARYGRAKYSSNEPKAREVKLQLKWQKVPYETAERVSTFSFFGKIRKSKDTWQITTCNKVTGKYEYGFSYSKKGAKDIVAFRQSQIENELLSFYESEH